MMTGAPIHRLTLERTAVVRKSRSRSALVAAGLAGALSLSACASASESESSATDDISIAFFYSEGNSYLTAGNESAKATADELGVTVTLFNSNFDPQQQLNQVETAVTQGGYDAFVIAPLDGNLICDYVRENVLDQEIPVVTFQGTLCGRDSERGEAQLEPGVFAHVTGQNLEIYEAWVAEIAENNPDGGTVAAMSGPPLIANTTNLNLALEQLPADFDIVANQTTDYTTPSAFAAAQTMLQANPDVDLFISNYSGLTQGMVEAVKSAGGSARIFDFGGDQWALDAVSSGDITSTVMMLPATETATAIRLSVDAINGGKSPGVVVLTDDASLPGTAFVTRENVSSFTAQY